MYKIMATLAVIMMCIIAVMVILPAIGYSGLFVWRYINARLYQHYTHCTRKEAYKRFKIY